MQSSKPDLDFTTDSNSDTSDAAKIQLVNRVFDLVHLSNPLYGSKRHVDHIVSFQREAPEPYLVARASFATTFLWALLYFADLKTSALFLLLFTIPVFDSFLTTSRGPPVHLIQCSEELEPLATL